MRKNCWADRSWESEIRKAVRASDVVLACLSRSSISRAGFIQKEIRFALDVADEQPEGAAYLMPVRFEECEIPDRLKRWQWVDVFEPHGNRRLFDALNERWKSVRRAADAEPRDGIVEPRDPLLHSIEASPVVIEVGFGLVSMLEGKDPPLLRRISAVRRQIGAEMGYLFPAVRAIDNLGLGAREYRILLKGGEVSRFELIPDRELAIAASAAAEKIEGFPVREPAFSLPALWIGRDQVDQAHRSNYAVVDHVSVIATHLLAVIRRHATEIFSIRDAQTFLDECRREHPLSVDALVPQALSLAALHAVLQRLLKEMVPIKDALTIVETLVQTSWITRNPVILTERVRKALRFSLTARLLRSDGSLAVHFLEEAIERALEAAVDPATGEAVLPAQSGQRIVSQVTAAIGSPLSDEVIVVAAPVRYALKQLIDHDLPGVRVLSRDEIPSEIKVVSKGVIGQGA